MADSTLTAIQNKVRRLTRSPSVAQLPDATLNEYINTFVLYDLPEQLRLFALRTTLTFYLQPYQDVYDTVLAPVTDPLYNFKNRYITTHEPCYVAGYQSLFSQSREQFYNIYPLTNQILNIAIGNGVITNFVGVLTGFPVIANYVTFSTVNAAGVKLVLHDDGLGNLVGDGVGPNTINYVTGAYVLNWAVAPGNGAAITAMTIPYQPSRPQAVLYFDNKFYVRPIPDKSYPVSMEVYIRPTELLNANQSPDLEQWWQYIAYGAAKKVFEDRFDFDSVQQLMPEFKQQELLVLRRTIVQQTNERAATIYTESTEFGLHGGFGSGYY